MGRRANEIKRMRGRALYEEYRRGLEDGCFDSFAEAGRWVAGRPAPRFYVSPRQASLLVGRIMAGVSLIALGPSMRRMTWDIMDRYSAWTEAHPGRKVSRERVMEDIVEQPAPEFYLTPEGARRILRDEVRARRRALGW